MFKKKDASLEIEMDDDLRQSKKGGAGEPAPSWATAPSGRAKPPPRGMVPAPRWTRIVHFSVHAFCSLLIAILVLVLVCVELDAKDNGEDGTANAILKPFRLNLDGGAGAGDATVCDQSFEASDGSTSSVSSNGYVQAAVSFVDVAETWSIPTDEWDAYVSPEIIFVGRDGSSRTLQEEKAATDAFRQSRRAANNSTAASASAAWSHEVTGFAMNDNQVVTQSQIKRAGVVVTSFFSVSVFDTQSGQIVQHLWYPSMSFETKRVENVQRMGSAFRFMFAPVSDEEFDATLKMLDGVLTDDFEFVQGNYYTISGRKMFKQMLRGLYESTKASPPKAHAMFYDNRLFIGGEGGTQHVLDRYLLYDGADARGAMVRAGYSDYTFGQSWPLDYTKIAKMEAFEIEYLSKRGEAALRYHQVLNATVAAATEEEKRASIEQMRELVDVGSWTYINDSGFIYSFEEWADAAASLATNPTRQRWWENKFTAPRFTEIEFADAVYVFWSDGAGGSPFAIHHFLPGTTTISSTYQSPHNMYQRGADGEIIDTRAADLARTKEFLSAVKEENFSDDLYSPRRALVSEDFVADTYFGGIQTLEELSDSAGASLKAHFDNEETRETLSEFVTTNAVVNHGVWRTPDGEVASTVLDIFEFEFFPEDPADRKISSFTVYKSTDVMNEEG